MSKKLPNSLLPINADSTAMFEATIVRNVTEVFLLTITYVFTGRNSVTGEPEQLTDTPATSICFYARKKEGSLQLAPAQNNPADWYKMFATEQFFAQLIAAAKEADPKATHLLFESGVDETFLINIFGEASQFSQVVEQEQVSALPFSSSFKEEFEEALDEEDEYLPAAFVCDLSKFDENGMAIP